MMSEREDRGMGGEAGGEEGREPRGGCGVEPRARSHLPAAPSPPVCPPVPMGKLKDKETPAFQESESAAHMCAPGLPQPVGKRGAGDSWTQRVGQTGPGAECGCPERQVHAE